MRIPEWIRCPWLISTVVLLLAFAALGILSRNVRPSSYMADGAEGYARMLYGTLVFTGIMRLVPSASAIIMVWIAFARPGWSDRFLWSAAMIFTTAELASVAAWVFAAPHELEGLALYPNPAAAVGAIAYASWLLIADRSSVSAWKRQVAGALCVLALLSIAAYPVFVEGYRIVDFAGSLLFAAACFTAGLFVAERVGVDLFARDVASESE